MSQGVDTLQIHSREYKWRWLALAGASLAVFMSALDSNVVNVALPIMARTFHAAGEIRWVVLSYILPTTALLGAFGALSDVVGRKRITLIGVTLFVAGSVLCALAQSLEQMVVFRIIQGVGGSCIGSAILAIATVNFAPQERGKAMAVVGLIVPLGGVVGPSLGGLLIGAFGWPAIFLINVPFGIIAFLLIFRLLPRDAAPQVKAFDVGGAILFSVALVLLIMGLSSSQGRLSNLDYVLLAACVMAIAGLVVLERRAANPLVPPSLVRRASFTIPLSGIMTIGIVGSALGFIMPFFLEVTLRQGPERAGLTLLFFPLAMAIASQVGGRLSDRFQPRVPAAIGATISLVGVLLLLPLNSTWGMVAMAVRFAVIGAGFGFFVSPSSVAVMSAAPRDHIGVSGALANTSRFLGFALGPTIAAIIWSPGIPGAAGIVSMRVVLLVLAGIQVLTIATVLGYRVQRDSGIEKSNAESTKISAA